MNLSFNSIKHPPLSDACLYQGDAFVRPFLALIYEFDDHVKDDFDDRGDCLFCETAPTQFVKETLK